MNEWLTLGNIRILPVLDGSQKLVRPGTSFYPETTEADWAAYRDEHLDAEGNVHLGLSCFLIRADGRTILVDTGVGDQMGPMAPGSELPEQLRSAGVAPEDVDMVLTTHLHWDHTGWNTVEREGRLAPLFPRARYVVQRAEWEHWMQPRSEATPWITEAEAARLARLVAPLQEAGAVDLVDGEQAVTPSVRALPSPGHTPGHMCILLWSERKGAIVLGDSAHWPVQVTEPDWVVGADRDKAQACRTRHMLWDRVEADGLTLLAGHFPAPHVGRIIRVEGRRYWRGGYSD